MSDLSFGDITDLWLTLSSSCSSLCRGKLIQNDDGSVEAAIITSMKKTPYGTKHFHQLILGNANNICLPPGDEDSIYSPSGRISARFTKSVTATCISNDDQPQTSTPGFIIQSILPSSCSGGYISTIMIPDKLHGAIFEKEFGPSRFDPTYERFIVYVADSFAGHRTGLAFSTSDSNSRFKFTHSWGEGHKNQHLGRIYVADTVTKSILSVEWPNETESLGQPNWLPDCSGLLVTAWATDKPFQLGTLYCQNRSTTIYLCGFQDELASTFSENRGSNFVIRLKPLVKLVTGVPTTFHPPLIVHSPLICWDRYTNETSIIRAACCAVSPLNSGAHWSSIIPSVCNLSMDRDSNILHMNPNVSLTGDLHSAFRWIALSRSYILAEVIVSTPPRTELIILKVDGDSLQSPISIQIPQRPKFSTIRLLDAVSINATHAVLLLSTSSPESPAVASVHQLAFTDPAPSLNPLDWALPKPSPAKVPCSISWEESRHLFLLSTIDKPLNKLLIWIHGGPHSLIMADYSLAMEFLLRLGYHILCVNYRGSVGFSDEELLSLPGSIGSQDVTDCVSAINSVLPKLNNVSPHVYIVGGSHGGFLALHLAGQFPDLVASVSARNPVTNLIANLAASDIPDWNLYEGAKQYFDGCAHPLQSSLVNTLYTNSPISHVHKVTCPMLIALGECDRRVPAFQGIEYYNSLISKCGSRNLHRVLYYPNNDHGLAHPEADADYWIQTALWFQNSNKQKGKESATNHCNGV